MKRETYLLASSAALAALLAAHASAQASPRYPNPFFQTGKLHEDVATGDLDHDGRLDVVALNAASNDVTVFRGDGTGKLSFLQHVAVGGLPRALAVAELTGDAHLDCLVVNQASATVSLLAGDGTGALSPQGSTFLGALANSLELADVDLDGDLDALTGSTSSIVLLTSNGAGAFSASTIVSGKASACAVGDVTGDGLPDVVFAPQAPLQMKVLQGDGAGGFTLLSTTSFAGSAILDVALADLDGDGDRDAALAVSNGNVTVMRNLGGGSFAAHVQLATMANPPARVVIADETGDGELDVVAFGYTVSVFRGSGAGTFGSDEHRPPLGLGTLADVDGDGRLDYVTGWVQKIYGFGGVAVWMRDSLGRWQGGYKYQQGPDAYAVVDIDQDGDPDYLDLALVGNQILTAVNDGLGNFVPGPTSPVVGVHQADAPIAGDFDGDGVADLVAPTTDAEIAVFPGLGEGTFGAAIVSLLAPIPPGTHYAPHVAVADFDQDGALDYAIDRKDSATETSAVVVYRGSGAGTFTLAGAVPFGAFAGYSDMPFACADLDGNGFVDVLAGDAPSPAGNGGRVSVALSSGPFQWQAPLATPLGTPAPYKVVASDFDADGIMDVAALHETALGNGAVALVTPMLGTGGGTFAPTPTITAGGFYILAMGLAVTDYDADGRDDLAVTHGNLYSASLIRNHGGGAFVLEERYAAQGLAFRVVATDLDSDGRQDLMGLFGQPLIAQAPVAACPGGFVEYGAGCHGGSYFVPHLAGVGCPSPGSSFAIALENAAPETNALLFLGAAPASLPLGFGCSFLVSPVGMQLVVVPLGGTGIGGGKVTLYGELPPGFPTGFSAYAQVFVPTGEVAWGYASSNGLRLDVQ